MKRFYVLVICMNLFALLLLTGPLITAEQTKAPQNDLEQQIKQMQKERVENLEKIVQILRKLFETGRAGFDITQVFSAESDLIYAKLEMTDDLKEKIVLLEDESKLAKQIVDLSEQRFKVATDSLIDVLSARSFYLKTQINLLKEKQRLEASPIGNR
jgi:hypothetical protein